MALEQRHDIADEDERETLLSQEVPFDWGCSKSPEDGGGGERKACDRDHAHPRLGGNDAGHEESATVDVHSCSTLGVLIALEEAEDECL